MYLQHIFKTSWKTKNGCAEDVMKMSSRHDLKTSLRRLEDQQMFAGLFFDDGLTQGSDDTTLTAEAIYSTNFTQSNRKYCLSLYYNGRNSFLFVNTAKIYQFKAKDSEIKNITCV